MSRVPRTAQECYNEAERRACLRMERSMARMLKAAQKRRDALEVKMGVDAYQSPAYLIEANEYMVLQHWKGWVARNCDYRRMQVDENAGGGVADG